MPGVWRRHGRMNRTGVITNASDTTVNARIANSDIIRREFRTDLTPCGDRSESGRVTISFTMQSPVLC